MAKIWVVVAAFNEAGRLGETLASLDTSRYVVAVVDDGSSDATSAIAGAYPVWLLRHPINCGAGAALRTGMTFALSRGADIIVAFDADGQHDAAEIPLLVAPARDGGFDVVIGSRFLGRTIDMPWSRGLVLRRPLVHAAVLRCRRRRSAQRLPRVLAPGGTTDSDYAGSDGACVGNRRTAAAAGAALV